jgi:hypothetical protein
MSEAVIGFLGAIVGATAAIGAVIVKDLLDRRRKEADDAPRKAVLLHMLQHKPTGTEWRRMETLSRVIGADREETARLLISIGARGSETGEEVWALISEKPLP